MARTIQQIQASIIEDIQASIVLSSRLTSTSMVATWRLLVYVFSVAVWTLEKLFDIFTVETDAKIAASKAHTVAWYKQKALDWLFGVELVPETDYYDFASLTEEEIQAAKIIANAAPVKEVLNGNGRLRIKLVKMVNDEYAPLMPDELTAIGTYFDRVSDAGTNVVPTTGDADMLKIKANAYFNPMVLNTEGARLDGTDPTPLPSGIKAHLKSIQFNGSLIIKRLTDDVETIAGVEIFEVLEAYSKYASYEYTTEGVANVGRIQQIRVADAGHMKLDEAQLEINWIPLNNEYL
jgi:hypothetical protein